VPWVRLASLRRMNEASWRHPGEKALLGKRAGNLVRTTAAVLRAVAALWFAAGVLWAHDPGLSTVQAQLHPDRLEWINGFAPADVELLLPPSVRPADRWTETEFEAAREALYRLAPQLWEADAGGALIAPRVVLVELAPEDAVNFHLEFPRPDAATLVMKARKLGELSSSHREFVMVADELGSSLTRKLLSARDSVIEVPLQAADGGAAHGGGSTAPTFWGFLLLGVEHIWTGYDHVLFLLALLVVCRGFASSIGIVTCFTLAHSLTLALATLDLVNLPSRWVEPLIAASIVFVGVENLARGGAEPRGRWLLTFAFGLVHGFGFATVLRDLGVGRGSEGIVMPLLSFNLGVELGQIAIAAVVLPLFWQARKRERFVRMGVPALSVAVAMAGAYWLIDRTVLS
jgi:hydrogenase/urease accessory protein HupE